MKRKYIIRQLEISRSHPDYMKLYYSRLKKEKWNIQGIGLKKENNPNWQGGKPKCLDCGKEITYLAKRCQKCAYKGKLNPSWAGGKKYIRQIRGTDKYALWRLRVFERDDYTCRYCFTRGGKLEVHHYPKSFKQLIKDYNIKTVEEALKCKKLWNLNLGITACKHCHNKTKKGVKT